MRVPRLPAAEKVRRDERIVADRARGFRWQTIAERHKVSERHARQVWSDRLAAEPLDTLGGAEAIAEGLLQLEAAIEDFSLLSERTSNDAVRIAAIRGRLAAMTDRMTLLRIAGFLPASWRAAATEADMLRVAETVRAVLKKHQPPDGLLADLIEALGRPAARANGHDR